MILSVVMVTDILLMAVYHVMVTQIVCHIVQQQHHQHHQHNQYKDLIAPSDPSLSVLQKRYLAKRMHRKRLFDDKITIVVEWKAVQLIHQRIQTASQQCLRARL